LIQGRRFESFTVHVTAPAPIEVVRLRARGLYARATARLRARPNFLVIGAQKAGTTSLHRYLADHPAVLCATPKEVHYFNINFFQRPAWYLMHFPFEARARSIRRRYGVEPPVGELTPCYLFHPQVPARVHAFDPEMRLIALLRDPVERAYSQYQMGTRKYGDTLSFEDALAREEQEAPVELARMAADPEYTWPHARRRSYVARGRYAEQLERWLALFPREQLLVLTSEELWSDPDIALQEIASFLGIPEWQPSRYPHQSAGSHAPMTAETRERLARLFEPENRRLEELLGRTFSWTAPATEPLESHQPP
jgi:hypothetical protein